MRLYLLILAALLTAVPAYALPVTSTDVCAEIRDSAVCLMAEPKCHWSGPERDCLDGPPPPQDACVVHSSESICRFSTLGCVWTEGKGCTARAK